MTPETFAEVFDVSRETIDRLMALEALLHQWNPRINLIARSTLPEIWSRHFADSAQLVDLAGRPITLWVDLGSGGGFPGLVVCALLRERFPGSRLVMIESDIRKAVFLTTALREMGLEGTVLPGRIEAAEPMGADVISARALAPLTRLLGLAERFRKPGTLLLFPKGRGVETELTEARRDWHIDATLHDSVTDPSGRIVRIRDYSPRT